MSLKSFKELSDSIRGGGIISPLVELEGLEGLRRVEIKEENTNYI